MGYTHHWYREPEISVETMRMIVEDFGKLIRVLDDNGVLLGGPIGDGVPEITPERIAFNGLTNCGHNENPQVRIPFPIPEAASISFGPGVVVEDRAVGPWGVFIHSRTCNGSCRYETFLFERVAPPTDWEKAMPDFDGLTLAPARPVFARTISPCAPSS